MGSVDDGGRPLLESGQFYSTVVGQERMDGYSLAELQQSGDREIPRHEHERSYLTLVLAGDYREATARGSTDLPAFTAIFNPSGLPHTGTVGPAGIRLFTIEVRPDWLAELDLRLPACPVVDAGAGAVLWPAAAMFCAWKSRSGDSFVYESHAMQMFGALAGGTPARAFSSPWLRRVKERLHAQFRGDLRIRELAVEAGVHPVHLARSFRAHVGCTPGEFVQRLRVRAACARLADRDARLADVAVECGFFDQSHFTRTFKRLVGTTPGAFRTVLVGRKSWKSA